MKARAISGLPAIPVFLALTATALYDCPFPQCTNCLPASVHDAPGVGFDLSFSYGTSAAHFLDGTVANLATIEATQDYMYLMVRLLSWLGPPPPQTALDRWRRWLNKKLGRPATADVAAIASMLAALRDETASALPPASAALDRVVVTRPPVKGLTDEDVRDALEYIGLRPWLISEGQAGMYPTDLLEVHAVLAAHGYGLCTNYKDLFECWEEVEAMPEHVVFFASFTRQSLHTSLATVTDAFGWSQKPLFANETLMDNGLGSLEYHSKPSVFWAEVRAQLARAVSRSPRPITKVLMAGENATHPDFVSTLEDVLKDAGGNTGRLQADSIDPTFAAARGAALYGSWRQQAPLGCREKANCEKDREKERGERLERTLEL